MAEPGSSAFKIIGHRGARGHAPENTLLSIDCAIRLGVDMVEFDVQKLGTELVLMHDLRVDRTTNGFGRLDQFDFESLRALDAGQGQRVPTLREVLDLVEQRIPLNVELKSADGTAELVAAELLGSIERGWTPEMFLVSSFHLPELDLFRELAPSIPIAALLCGVPLDFAAGAGELGAVALNIAADFVDPRLVADAKARGLQVFVYTVNDAEEMLRLRAIGVDGLFTDFPARARAAFSVAGEV